ncbi:MAG: hypothetical protein GX971_07680 [Firmicutes bacterium]|nr:hypothetical protein [Bacillota bacterium]
MRKLTCGLLVFLLCSLPGYARVSVSPVIVEAVNVQAGQVFQITCQQQGTEQVELGLSLALFDQDKQGGVVFLEDDCSVLTVRENLRLASDNLVLEPNQQTTIQVEVARDEFDHLYAVLFIKPKQMGIPTRLAVLFLLSTSGAQADFDISAWERNERTLNLTVYNKGLSHGFWTGELLCSDAAGERAERLAVQSGTVLAGRSRGLSIDLPSWVQDVEVLPTQKGSRP